MAKRDRKPRSAARAKRDREIAEGLTFLEKLVLRVLSTRQVPAESGVRFAISSKAKADGLCLLFRVDDPEAPIVEEGPRPDYLALHLSKSRCLLTIIEMKGTEEKNIEHGIEQICAFYHRLRKEMAGCLPGSWRQARIQGLLLTPQNAHLNRKKLEEAHKQGVDILPLQYHHQAELYPYISEPISRTKSYAHAKLPRDTPELNPLEQLIAEGRLDRRVRDAWFLARRGHDEDTFFLNFKRPKDPDDAYISLSATRDDAVVAFSSAEHPSRVVVSAHLEEHGLTCSALRLA